MKKLILAFIALAFAFAISSCCDQSYCPKNQKCNEQNSSQKNENPCRLSPPEPVPSTSCQEKQHRRW